MAIPYRKFYLQAAAVLAVAGGAFLIWSYLQSEVLPDGIAKGNGRIEAVEVDIAAKTSGRIEAILVEEGDYVNPGQVLARLDTAALLAQLREAEAQLQRTIVGVDTAESQVTQREAQCSAADAVVLQREAERDVALKKLERTAELADKGTATKQSLDEDQARFASARAAVSAANAQVAAAEAACSNAKSQVIAAQSAVEAARATVQRIKTEIEDSVLKAPRAGRIQYRVAEPGEVISAGRPLLNLVDLSDVYMPFFLPTEQAGRIAIGSEARIVLDASPQHVIPARISFVADVAQFTPKSVETEEERQKLMFRVKAKIDEAVLAKYQSYVKTGLPGVAYVRLDPAVSWPAELQNVLQR